MADEQLRQQQIPKQQKVVKPVEVAKAPVKQEIKTDVKAEDAEKKVEEQKLEDIAEEHGSKPFEKVSKPGDEKKPGDEADEKKVEKPKKKQPAKAVVRKYEAVVHGKSLPISTKYAVAIAYFIKNIRIDEAMENLEKVMKKQMAVPMKGELAHRKGLRLDGKKMMSGKYPLKASKYFIKLLKTLNANATINGMELENTKITEVIANKAPKQLHRGGSMEHKRTHVMIKVKEVKK